MRKVPDAIILCGGAGLRLRSVIGNAPKPMACIAGRPFLELLLSQLHVHKFRRVILAVGYQREVIQKHFAERWHDMRLKYSIEVSPLGTGGALSNTVDMVESDAAFIMNGDSYADADLGLFVDDFRSSNADASLVVVPAGERRDCGSVLINPDGNVARFVEKRNLSGSRYANAGLYLVSRRLLGAIPSGIKVSLEEELLPHWLGEQNSIRAFVHHGECIDIGTPDRFRSAQSIFTGAKQEAVTPRREVRS